MIDIACLLAWMMLLLSSGPRDLLDLMPTDAYWQEKSVQVTPQAMIADLVASAPSDITAQVQKLGAEDFSEREAATQAIRRLGLNAIPQLKAAAQSKDAEVASRAAALLEELAKDGPARAVRRLMAIRTLGELRKPEGLAALKPLLASSELFEAEYAARAIARIEGKPYTLAALAREARAADLQLLPARCAIVGQISAVGAHDGSTITLDTYLESTAALLGWEPGAADEDRKLRQVRQTAASSILKGLEQTGNIRLDGITLGFSEDLGGPGDHGGNGFVVAVLHGVYDHQAMARVIPVRQEDGRETSDGVDILHPAYDAGTTLLLPSDDRLILVGGADHQDQVREVLAALRAGKGSDAAAKNLAALTKLADTAAPHWMSVRVTESYRQYSLLAAFDGMGLEGRVTDGVLSVKWSATGRDPAKLKDSVEKVRKGVADWGAEVKDEVQRWRMPAAGVPLVQPLLDAVESVKLEAGGIAASGSMTIQCGPRTTLGIPMLLLAKLRLRPDDLRPAPVPATAPAQTPDPPGP